MNTHCGRIFTTNREEPPWSGRALQRLSRDKNVFVSGVGIVNAIGLAERKIRQACLVDDEDALNRRQWLKKWLVARTHLEYALAMLAIGLLALVVVLLVALNRESGPLETVWGNVAELVGVVVTFLVLSGQLRRFGYKISQLGCNISSGKPGCLKNQLLIWQGNATQVLKSFSNRSKRPNACWWNTRSTLG